jgi:hypothetical protein
VQLADLRVFEQMIAEDLPGFQVRFKNGSRLQQALGFLMRPFNPGYLDTYITTLGRTVWFPSFRYYTKDPEASFVVLAHEYVHLHDARRYPGWFQLSYLLPQAFVLVPLLAYAWLAWPFAGILLVPFLAYALACAAKSRLGFGAIVSAGVGLALLASWFFSGWATLVLVGGLGLVGPWPAPWRTHWELRGYAMTIAARMWLSGRPPVPDLLVYIERQFTGFSYFRMAWRGTAVRTALLEVVQRVSEGRFDEAPYAKVHDFIYRHSLLHGGPA